MEQILDAITTIKKNGRSYYSKSCRQRVLDNFDFKKVNINAIEKLGGQLDIIQNAFRSYKVIFANSDKLE